MQRSRGWGWTVTKKEREAEIARLDKVIALYDVLLASGVECSDDYNDVEAIALTNRAISERLGLSEQDCRDLACCYEYWPDWLPEGPQKYTHGEAVQAALIDRCGETAVCSSTGWKAARSAAVRQRGAARRAIADGRAQ